MRHQTPTFGTAPIRGSTGCLVLGLRCLIFVMGSACIGFPFFRPCFVHGPGILLVHSSFCPSSLGSSFSLEGWSLSTRDERKGRLFEGKEKVSDRIHSNESEPARAHERLFLPTWRIRRRKESRFRSACAGPEDPACFFGASTLQVPTLLLWMADG